MDVISKFKIEYPKVSFNIKHEDYADYSSYSEYDVIISDRNINSDVFESRLFVHEEVFLQCTKILR